MAGIDEIYANEEGSGQEETEGERRRGGGKGQVKMDAIGRRQLKVKR